MWDAHFYFLIEATNFTFNYSLKCGWKVQKRVIVSLFNYRENLCFINSTGDKVETSLDALEKLSWEMLLSLSLIFKSAERKYLFIMMRAFQL